MTTLSERLKAHAAWLAGYPEGRRLVERGADLYGADLYGADLREAYLRGADLRGADLDHSAWPLWCGSLGVKADGRLARQLLYHALDFALGCDDDALKAVISKRLLAEVNKSHVVTRREQAPLTKEADSE